MIRTHETTLRGALGRLRWALSRPLSCDDPEWGARTWRALATLRDALDRHIQSLDVAAILLRSRRDPFLPLFALPDRPVSEETHAFQKRLVLLQMQAENATRAGEAARPNSATAVQAFRSLARVARDAEQLAEAMDHYLSEGTGSYVSGD